MNYLGTLTIINTWLWIHISIISALFYNLNDPEQNKHFPYEAQRLAMFSSVETVNRAS